MARLFVTLFDSVTVDSRFINITDEIEGNRKLFHNLNRANPPFVDQPFPDKAARVRVLQGDEYRRGDHILLLDRVRQGNTATVAVDPDVVEGDVDLNQVGFADRAAALKMILNPNPTGGFRLRVELFDRFGQRPPDLVLYDWQYPPEEGPADLNFYHFADRTAFVILERGPDFREGDTVFLQDTVDGENELEIRPSQQKTPIDLNTENFADKAAAVRFEL
jgi:hypothetical protein